MILPTQDLTIKQNPYNNYSGLRLEYGSGLRMIQTSEMSGARTDAAWLNLGLYYQTAGAMRVGAFMRLADTTGKLSELNAPLHTYPDSSITHYTGFHETFLEVV